MYAGGEDENDFVIKMQKYPGRILSKKHYVRH